jgi:hypothetical protein
MSMGATKRGYCVETPEPDPRWQARLGRLCPPNGELSWLTFYYEPGFPWEPVHRWMIGQVIPHHRISDVERAWLEGPNPADYGYLRDGEWVSLLPGVTRRQWEFYRKTGSHIKPYWVVQGNHGGHKLRLNFAERRLVELKGGDPTLPAPGDLPFAVPDERTFAKLAKLDRMRQSSALLNFIENSTQRLDAETQREVEQMRTEMWGWLSSQIESVSDEMAFHLRGKLDDAPTGDPHLEGKLEAFEHEFITQGA